MAIDTHAVSREVLAHVTPVPRKIDVIELDDANAQSWTCPTGTRVVVISADDEVWIRTGDTAAVPTADVTDGTGSLFIPANQHFWFEVEEGVAYSLIRGTANATLVSIGRFSA